MISRYFHHLCLLIIFLLGSTISCAASLGNPLSDGFHTGHIQQESTDDCCEKNNHKKQFDGKNIGDSHMKKNIDFEANIPQAKIVYNHESRHIIQYIFIYTAPIWDRQSLFFTDTIRLII